MNEAPVVLSVDDEPAVTGLVRLYLNEAGYEVMAAASGTRRCTSSASGGRI